MNTSVNQPSGSNLQLFLLGTPQIRLNGEPLISLKSVKAQALLFYLAVSRRAHTRPALAGLLWGEMPESAARGNLRKALSQLRAQLGEYISTGRDSVSLLEDVNCWVDVVELDQTLQEVDQSEEYGRLQRVVDLYSGDFLDGFFVRKAPEFENWWLAERARLREQFLNSLQRFADFRAGEGDLEDAVALTRRFLTFEPWSEAGHRRLMLLLAQNGQRGAALLQYETCRRILREELDTTPSSETTELFKHIQNGVIVSPGQEKSIPPYAYPPSSQRHNLPIQTTPFIGREHELADLSQLLVDPEIRLVTILGVGGMGKTRLALRLGEELLDTFPDGVYFVDLTPLDQVSNILLTIAETLNLHIRAGKGPQGSPRQQFLDYLRDKQMLLILDNFEHLLGGADLVFDMLKAAPNVHILVTSRERLQLQQEQLFPIQSLQYSEWETLKVAEEYTAVQLFVQAAHRIQPDFKLTSSDLIYLAEICRLVEGMPLALELAASWVELLSLKKIVVEIRQSIDFLRTELRDLPNRHRSMRAMFETTWNRLSPEEREVVKGLSVFRGGFSREAAAQVVTDQNEYDKTFILLASLVKKSLLKVDQVRGRYQIHELLRKYAHEQLAENGGLDGASTIHSEYYLEMLSQREYEIKGNRQKGALDEIEVDFANIRVAWKWALSQGNQTAIDRSITSLCLFCSLRGFFLEGMELIKMAERQFEPDINREMNKTWRRIAMHRIYLDHQVWSEELTRKIEETEKILAAAEVADDLTEVAFGLFNLGYLLYNLDLEISLKNFEKSLKIYHQLCDEFFELVLLDVISFVHLSLGRLQKRVQGEEKRLDLARKIGDRLTIAVALANIGFVKDISGSFQEAKINYQEAITLFQEMGNNHQGAEIIARFGWLGFLNGDIDLARTFINQGLLLAKKFNHPLTINMTQSMLAMIYNFDKQYDQAIQICKDVAQFKSFWAFEGLRGLMYASYGLGEYDVAREYMIDAIRIARSMNAIGWITQCLPAAAVLSAYNGHRERAVELLSLAYHHPRSATGWLKKFPLIQNLQTSLEKDLSSETYSKVWQRGQTLDLEETITNLQSQIQNS